MLSIKETIEVLFFLSLISSNFWCIRKINTLLQYEKEQSLFLKNLHTSILHKEDTEAGLNKRLNFLQQAQFSPNSNKRF